MQSSRHLHAPGSHDFPNRNNGESNILRYGRPPKAHSPVRRQFASAHVRPQHKMPFLRKPGSTAIVELFMIALITGASAPDAAEAKTQGESNAMLLLLPEGDDTASELSRVEAALEAHLRPYGIDVLPLFASTLEPAALRAEPTRQLLRTQGANSLVWIDVTKRRVILIYVDSAGAESWLERDFDCVSDNIGRCADAIASVVSSAVSSWIGPPSARVEQHSEIVGMDNELSPVQLSQPAWRKPDPMVRLSLGVGYGVTLFDGTAHAAHGFDATIAAVLVKYARVETAFDLFWPLRGHSSVNAGNIKIRRWSLAARAGGALPIDRWTLALTAGIAFDFADLASVSDHIELVNVDEIRKGFSTAFTVQWRITERISIWSVAGLDVFGSDLTYRGKDEFGKEALLLRCAALQARIVLGAEVDFGLGRLNHPRTTRK